MTYYAHVHIFPSYGMYFTELWYLLY